MLLHSIILTHHELRKLKKRAQKIVLNLINKQLLLNANSENFQKKNHLRDLIINKFKKQDNFYQC